MEEKIEEDVLLSFKCPSCGASLAFNAENQSFVCSFCNSSFDLDDVKNADVNTEKAFEWGNYKENVSSENLEGTVSYVCKSCGAEIVTDSVTAATKCPYCDNFVVIDKNLSGFIKPNGVIPFKFGNEKLSEILKQFCKGKFLLPKNFITDNKIKEVKGTYVPFWLFDARADGNVTYEATTVRVWSDSKYNYTETNYFYVIVDGEMGFRKVPVDASLKLDDALMDSIEPFDFSEIQEFAPGFLSGFIADRFDVAADDSIPRADSRIKRTVEDSFRSNVNGYSTVIKLHSDLKLYDTDVKYVLLPVYIVSSKYNGKIYNFAVNGQTGKVAGKLPISWKRFWAFFAGIGTCLSVLFILLWILLGGII